MKLLMTCLASILCLGITSCGKTRVYNSEELPGWVSNPYTDGEIGGTGSSVPQQDFNQTLTKAEMSARDELAKSFQTQVKSVMTSTFNEITKSRESNNTSFAFYQEANEFFKEVSEHLTDVVVQMSHRKEFWTHPDTDELFVWVVMSEQYKEDALNKAIKLAEERALEPEKEVEEMTTFMVQDIKEPKIHRETVAETMGIVKAGIIEGSADWFISIIGSKVTYVICGLIGLVMLLNKRS